MASPFAPLAGRILAACIQGHLSRTKLTVNFTPGVLQSPIYSSYSDSLVDLGIVWLVCSRCNRNSKKPNNATSGY